MGDDIPSFEGCTLTWVNDFLRENYVACVGSIRERLDSREGALEDFNIAVMI